MKKLVFLFLVLFFPQIVSADIVYTTSDVLGSPSNSNVPSQPNSQSQGFVIGQFTNTTTFNFSIDKAVIRFTTGSSNKLDFTGIQWNSFLDDHAGSTVSGITSGNFLWTLYNNQNGSNSTFSQSINPVVHSGADFSPNVYQNGTWSLLTGTSILDVSTTYTLALNGITIGSTTGTLNQDELHWTYYTSPAAGGEYNIIGTGTMVTPSGNGSITSISPSSPGIGLAYDLNAVIVPEPNNFLIPVLVFFFGIWILSKGKARLISRV